MFKYKKYIFWLFIVLVISALLRYSYLTSESLWVDEAFGLWLSRLSLSRMIEVINNIDAHPPLFYLLFRLWSRFGEDVFFIRVPFPLINLFAILFIYKFTSRLISPIAGLAAALFMGISFYCVSISQMARMYVLVMFLISISIYCWIEYLKSGSKSALVIYSACELASFYTLYISLIPYFFLGLESLFYFYFKARNKLKEFILSQALVIVLFSFWVPFMFHQSKRGMGSVFPYPTVKLLIFHLYYLLYGEIISWSGMVGVEWEMWIELIMILVATGVIIYGYVKEKDDIARILMRVLAFGYLIVLIISSTSSKHLYASRYIFYLWPFIAFSLGVGFKNLFFKGFGKGLAILFLVLWSVFNISALFHLYFNPLVQLPDWERAAEIVTVEEAPGDLILIQRIYVVFPFLYYYRGVNEVYGIKNSNELPPQVLKAKRIWLVLDMPWIEDPDLTLIRWIKKNYLPEKNFLLESIHEGEGIQITLYLKK